MAKKRIRRTDAYFKQEVFDITNGEYVPTSTFVKTKTKVSMLHKKCGNTWSIRPNDFLHQGKRCPSCAYDARRGTTEEYSDKVETLTGVEYVVEGEYKNAHTPIPMLHTVCGNVYDVSPHNFLRGDRCPRCAGNEKGSTEEFKAIVFDLVGDDIEVLGEYMGALTPIPLRHKTCGHRWNPTPSIIINKGSRCPYCIYSRGEKAVQDALDSLSIDYIREHSFPDLGRKRFDFYIPSLHAVIEYDGEQHFKAVEYWGGEDTLERIRQSDALKDAFCEHENIALLRIPYTEFDRVSEIVEGFVEDTRTFNALFAPNNEKESVL